MDTIMSIGHAAFATNNMPAILDFYCTKLGCKHAFNLKTPDGTPWIEYIKVGDGAFIDFFSAKEPVPKQSGPFQHLCLQISDVEETVKFLNEHGITITAGPSVGQDNNTQCWIKDPDGNPIELMCINPESPQAKS